MNTETDEFLEAANTVETTSTETPLPGLDILDIVRREVMRAASEGNPPCYAFIRMDIYILAIEAYNVRGGLRWVNPDTELDCTLRPLYPGEGQNPFILAYDIDQANQVIIGSFPKGTFIETPTVASPETPTVASPEDVSLL